MITKSKLRIKRSERNRFQLKKKSKTVFRLSVFRSNKHIYAQIIDEEKQKTLYCASSIQKSFEYKNGSDKNAAYKVGELIAEKAIKGGFKQNISFDRGGYLYHGRVQQLAEGARSKGLKL
mgnify:CR=1 FL=1